MKIGRNEPCPCGSGKKYKHCCLSTAVATSNELKEFLSSQEFGSLAELQAATATFLTKQNLLPRDDFLDLSSKRVYRMLHFAFDSPELFQFSDLLSVDPDALSGNTNSGQLTCYKTEQFYLLPTEVV